MNARNHRFIFLITLILIGSNGMNAQWSDNPAVNTAICTAQNHQLNPKIVTDNSGGAIIAWRDFRSGLDRAIYAQRINANGEEQWTSNGIPICTGIQVLSDLQIISDGVGGVIITWVSYLSGNEFIHAQRVNSNGVLLWAANGVQITNTKAGIFGPPQLALDSLGSTIIAWTDIRDDYDIYAQKINSTGTVQWATNGIPISITSFQVLPPQNVQISTDGLGGAYITWASGNSDPHVYAQRVDASGITQWGSSGVNISSTTEYASQQKIISDGLSGAIIVWRNIRNSTIYAQRINPSGIKQWADSGVEISSQSFPGNDYPTLVTDGASGAIITWSSSDSSDSNISAQRVGSNGSLLWTSQGVEICSAINSQIRQELVSDGIGGAIITWMDLRNGSDFNIYGQRINSIGSTLWTSDGIAISTTQNDKQAQQIVSDENAGAIITWINNRNDTTDIYAQKINANGTLPASNCSSDYESLKALYRSTNGPSWTHTWDTTDCTVTGWYGVTKDSNDRVVELRLSNNGVHGNLPPEIGNLSNLTYLNLGSNQLNGIIPDQLGSLTNLEYLYLNDNQLNDTIQNQFDSLLSLRYFYLSSNQLTGTILNRFRNVTNLRALGLNNNKFYDSIPGHLGDLTTLDYLHLGNNKFTGTIPSQLGNLSNLTYLALNNNLLTGSIPKELGNLTQLESLYLLNNKLSGCFHASLHALCTNLTNYSFFGNPNLPGGGDFPAFCSVHTGECIDCLNLSPLKPTFTIIQPTCSVPTGTITITNKVAQDSASFDNGLTYQLSNIKSGLTPGNYRVLIKSINGCVSPDSLATINPIQGIPATPILNIMQPTCAIRSGRITITNKLSQDSASFDNGLTFQRSNLKTGLLSNSFIVLIKNIAGCISQSTVGMITSIPIVPAKPILSLIQPNCNNPTGSIVITNKATIDSASFDNGHTYQTSNTKSGLIPGTYVVYLKSSSGCISNFTNTQLNGVPGNPATPLFNITKPTCTNAKGSITVVNRLSADSVSFDNGLTYQRSNVKSGLAPGNYRIVIKTVFFCLSGSVVATINPAPNVPPIPILTITQPSCPIPSGTLNIANKPPLDSASFDNGLTYQLSPVISGLAPGTYIVRIKSISGCISGSRNAVISTLPLIPSAPILSITQPSCTRPTGTIRITNKSGADSASFNNGLTYQSGSVKSGLAPGNYNVLIKRAASCFSMFIPVILTAPSLSISINNLDSAYYKFSSSFRLTGTPANGLFMVDSMNLINNILDPKKWALGAHTVTFKVTQGGCMASVSQEVIIKTYSLAGEGTQCYAIRDSINPLLSAGSLNGSSANNTIINRQTYLDSTYQKWTITEVNGFKHIRNNKSGLFLKGLSNGSVAQGVLDSTADWFVIPNSNETAFSLYNPLRARYLTLNGSTGYSLTIASASGKPGANQKFNFVPVNCAHSPGPDSLTLTLPQDTTVYLSANSCDSISQCDILLSWLSDATATGCDSNVTIKSVIIGETDTSFGAYLVRPFAIGSTSILVIANDVCGNMVKDTLIVTVIDTVKPCVRSRYLNNIYDPAIVLLNARKFDAGSFDNCTEISKLKYSWTKDVNDTLLMVDCNTVRILHSGGDLIIDTVTFLPFELIFNLFVTDASGNQDTSSSYEYIAFFDTINFCNKWNLISNPTSLKKQNQVLGNKPRFPYVFPNLNLFPNPNSGQFTIRFDQLDISKPSELSIYSILGQRIRNQKITSSDPIKINLGERNAGKGMYILVLKNGDDIGERKFIIN